MYVQMDYKQIVGEVKEQNRYFRALQEIQKVTDDFNEDNFQAQSEFIAEICKQALKRPPNKLSKKKKKFIEDYEAQQEAILSGEIFEQFEV